MAQEVSLKRAMELSDLYRFHRVAEPTLSSDGKWIAFQQSTINVEANQSSIAIYIVPTDGSLPPRLLTSSGKKDLRPDFHPIVAILFSNPIAPVPCNYGLSTSTAVKLDN